MGELLVGLGVVTLSHQPLEPESLGQLLDRLSLEAGEGQALESPRADAAYSPRSSSS